MCCACAASVPTDASIAIFQRIVARGKAGELLQRLGHADDALPITAQVTLVYVLVECMQERIDMRKQAGVDSGELQSDTSAANDADLWTRQFEPVVDMFARLCEMTSTRVCCALIPVAAI